MTTTRASLSARLIIAIAVATFASTHHSGALMRHWGNTGTDFNTAGDWVEGFVPGINDVAEFDTASVINPDLSASLTIQSLSFDAVSGYTLTNSNSATLTLTNNGSSDTIGTSAVRASNTSGTNTINAPLIFAGTAGQVQSLSQAAGGTLIVNGTLSAATAITAVRLGGGGIIDLTADNSATLSTPVNLAGDTTLQIGNNNALGTGLFTVTGTNATIQNDSATGRVLPNAILISANTTTFGGTDGNLTFGAMTQDNNQNIIVNNIVLKVASLGSTAAATRDLTKEGPGALLVTGNRTEGGETKITDGTFGVAGSFTSKNVNLNGGVLALNDAGLGGPFTRTLGTTNTTMRWTDSGGFAAYGSNPSWGAANNLTVNVGGAGATLTWGSTSNFLASGQTLIFGDSVSNGTVIFQNGLNFGVSNQTIATNRGSASPTNGVDAVISGVIGSSGGGFTKNGDGTLQLTGNNTYTGTTIVDAGTLLVDGNQSAATGAVTVNDLATLGGTGIIGGSVTVNSGGTLAPGNSTGILTTGSLTLNSTSNFVLELNNTTAGSGYDQMVVKGSVNLNLGNIVLSVGGALQIGDKFYVILNDGTDAVNGTFAQGSTVTSGAYTFTINYSDNGDAGSTANDVSLTVTAVPEPSTWALLALGALGIGYMQRRKLRRLFA